MVLPGTSCAFGAEPGPGLKPLAEMPAWWDQFPEPAGALSALCLISSHAALSGQRDPRGRRGQLGSGGCCPPRRTAPSPPWALAHGCCSLPPPRAVSLIHPDP